MDLETRLDVIIDCFISGLDSDYKKTFINRLMEEFCYEYEKRLDKKHIAKSNKWIGAEVLDKIKVEIKQTVSRYSISRERGGMEQIEWSNRLIKESEVLQIIDKYKAESEE